MNISEFNKLALSLIHKAVRAPSSHNTQPWLFRVTGSVIDLFADRTRALPVNDPEDRELVISCGCALMNLRIAAVNHGFHAQTELLPDAGEPDWLARITLSQESTVSASQNTLAEFIERRRTCRQRFASHQVDSAMLDRLIEAASHEGACLRPLLTGETRQQVGRLIAEGDARQWSNPGWRAELAAWLRPRRRGDGLTVPTLAVPVARFVVKAFNPGGIIGAKDRKLAKTAPLLGVLGTVSDHSRDWLQAGQALQHILLVACQHGLQASYFNQPIQVASLRPKLQNFISDGFPQILFQLGRPLKESPDSPRRPIAEVIEWME
jgi:nitroreductase